VCYEGGRTVSLLSSLLQEHIALNISSASYSMSLRRSARLKESAPRLTLYEVESQDEEDARLDATGSSSARPAFSASRKRKRVLDYNKAFSFEEENDDQEDQPVRKRTRSINASAGRVKRATAASGSAKPSRKRAGKLVLLPRMPLDILYQVRL
jgi:hypothetical protein